MLSGEKITIKNRRQQVMAVLLARQVSPQGLVFVMHGLGGFKEQAHIQAIASAFHQKNFTVVLFDTTNSIGESEGDYERATVTGYLEDLEDLLAWSATQSWYQEPFVLSGHSLGGMCVSLYAARHPEKIWALAPVSPVVSGKLSVLNHEKRDPDFWLWKKQGWLIKDSFSKPGITKKLPWSHMEDRLRYDLLPLAPRLTMPVMLVVGELDPSTPVEHVQLFYDALQYKKRLHIIEGAPHTFRSDSDLRELKAVLVDWIADLLSAHTQEK